MVSGSARRSRTELWSTRGVITVYNPDHPDDAESQRWHAQHCQLHDKPDVVDIQAPEWEPFDLSSVHAAMVTPVADVIAEVTRSLTEGLTDAWAPKWTYPARRGLISNAVATDSSLCESAGARGSTRPGGPLGG